MPRNGCSNVHILRVPKLLFPSLASLLICLVDFQEDDTPFLVFPSKPPKRACPKKSRERPGDSPAKALRIGRRRGAAAWLAGAAGGGARGGVGPGGEPRRPRPRGAGCSHGKGPSRIRVEFEFQGFKPKVFDFVGSLLPWGFNLRSTHHFGGLILHQSHPQSHPHLQFPQ